MRTKNVLVIGESSERQNLMLDLLGRAGYNIIREPLTIPRELRGVQFEAVFVSEQVHYAPKT